MRPRMCRALVEKVEEAVGVENGAIKCDSFRIESDEFETRYIFRRNGVDSVYFVTPLLKAGDTVLFEGNYSFEITVPFIVGG